MLLITGANGQVGQCFQRLAADFPKWNFHFAAGDVLDVTDKRAVDRFFQEHKGLRWVINCAAYTAVDKAETEPAIAKRINVGGVKNLAEACAAHDATLIHFSTDYVYHSQQNTAYKEDDPVRPKSVYARSKLAGERAAFQAHPNGVMVLRTSWVYAPVGHNFAKTMLRLGRERSAISVVADQIGTPTYAPDLALAVLHIIEKVEEGQVNKKTLAGIWHYSNEGVASWYDFAQAIFDLKNMPCMVTPIETKDYPTPALRPAFSVLNKAKIKAAFQLDIPHWRASLARCLAIMEG